MHHKEFYISDMKSRSKDQAGPDRIRQDQTGIDRNRQEQTGLYIWYRKLLHHNYCIIKKFIYQIGNQEVKENPTEKNEVWRRWIKKIKKAVSKTAQDRGQKIGGSDITPSFFPVLINIAIFGQYRAMLFILKVLRYSNNQMQKMTPFYPGMKLCIWKSKNFAQKFPLTLTKFL